MPRKARLSHKKSKSINAIHSQLNYTAIDQHASSLGFTKVSGKVEYVIISSEDAMVTHYVSFTDGGWRAEIKGTPLPDCEPHISSTNSVIQLFTRVAQSRLCQGNSDLKPTDHRSKDCETILSASAPKTSLRCGKCSVYRGTLRKAKSRAANSADNDRVAADSRTPFSTLSSTELLDRCRNLSASRQRTLKEIKDLKARISSIIAEKSVEVPESDVNESCKTKLIEGINNLPADSVKRLFLEQQLKAITATTASARRWHPTILRWCLIMHKKSKTLYRYMRQSEFVCLPSERTLSDYRCYRDVNSGVDQLHILDCLEKYGEQDVSILIDEMKVQEGLVYNSSSGDLWGFVDSLEADSLLDCVANSASTAPSTISKSEPLATHALSFMIRGLQSSLQAVVATYGSHCMTAERLFTRFWEVTANLELAGFRVRCCVSDGASINRKFYKLHMDDYPSDVVTHRARNRFAPDDRPIYLVSDTCHLMKTTRNGMENSGGNRNSRRLVLGGKYVLWPHITRLVEGGESGAVTMLHKITPAHTKLTSYGRMKVKLAVQVLSRSVANALRMKQDSQYDSTILFIEKFNDAFDILNTKGKDQGTRERNRFKEKLSSIQDWRFEWLRGFIEWLRAWQQQVDSQDILPEEKVRCLLPPSTIEGWYMTCYSFISLGKTLLEEGYDFILSEKILCQDPLEQYFSKQRDSTGSNNNPTMAQVLNYNRLHNVCQSVEVELSGNCTHTTAKSGIQINNEPLKKRPRSKNAQS